MTDGRLVDGNRDLGSAFALAPHTVVTADHVVGKASLDSLVFRSAAGQQARISRIERDPALDIAVLHTADALNSTFTVGQARMSAGWRVTAQPLGNDPKLTGTVTDVARSVENQGRNRVDLIQLRVDQAVGNYKGYSGGAVLSGSGVIGVLVEQVLHRLARGPAEASNVLYALPIQDVLDRFGLRPDASLIPGLAGLASDYAPWIENFLAEYLGRPRQSLVPFGGRDSALESLNSWLAGDTPYALVAAEAGRGKSALLSHWAAQVYVSGSADVIFVPISIRFNTAQAGVALPALAARLAAFHGESLTSTGRSAEQWQAEISTYLRRPPRRPLLVVIDGLDEATDWEVGAHLFPAAPPSGLRVLVAARTIAGDNWRDRLNWPHATSVALPPLDLDGVSDVLQAMGNPLAGLVTRVDMVGELYRLSEGDPLLVRLYVESLRDKDVLRLSADELPSIEKGLRGYYNRWRRELLPVAPVKDVQDFLNMLACALGPLSRADVAALNPAFTGLALEGLLDHVARFVIGDGRDQGFVFSHPRFGIFFHEVMGSLEQDRWNAAFVEYGRWTFTAPSPYVLNFYGAHLEASHAPSEDLYALLDSSWLAAWNAVDGTDAGFLSDCDRAWRRAEQEPPSEQTLEVMFLAALARGSVAARSDKIPIRLLIEAFKEDMLTAAQTVAICRRISDDRQRATAAVELAKVLPSHWLDQCVAIASASYREPSRAHMIVELAPVLTGHTLTRVRAIAESLTRPQSRSIALAAVSSRLAEPERAGVVARALSTVDEIRRPRERAVTLIAMAPFLAPAALSQAAAMAAALPDPVAAIRVLCELAWYLPAAERDQAIAVAVDRLDTAQLDVHAGIRARFALADHIPDLRMPALRDLEQLPHEQVMPLIVKAWRWISDGPVYLRSGTLIFALTNAIGGSDDTTAAAVIRLMSDMSRNQNSSTTLEEWYSPREPLMTAYLLAADGQLASAEIVRETLEQASQVEDAQRPLLLTLLASCHTGQSKRDLLAQALRLARTVGDSSVRAVTMAAACGRLAAEDRPAAHAKLVTLWRDHFAESGLSDLLIVLGHLLSPQVVDDVVELCMRYADTEDRAHALYALCDCAEETRRPEIRARALAEVVRIPDPDVRFVALANLPRQSITYYPRARVVTKASPGNQELDRALLAADEQSPRGVMRLLGNLRTDAAKHVAVRRYVDSPAERAELLANLRPEADEVYDDEDSYGTQFRWLPDDLPGDIVTRFLELVGDDRDALLELIPLAAPDQVESVLAKVLSLAPGGPDDELAESLLSAYSRLDEDARIRVLPLILGSAGGRSRRIQHLAHYVPAGQLATVVAAARELSADEQMDLWKALHVEYLEDVIEPLRQAALDADPATLRFDVVIEVARHAQPERQAQLLEHALRFAGSQAPPERLGALKALHKDGPKSWQPVVANELFTLITMAPSDFRDRALGAVARILRADHLDELEHLALDIRDPYRRLTALCTLMPLRDAADRRPIFSAIVDTIRDTGEAKRFLLLRVLNRRLPLAEPMIETLHELVGSCPPIDQPDLLIALSRQQMPAVKLRQVTAEAVRWVAQIEQDSDRDRALVELTRLSAQRGSDLAEIVHEVVRIRSAEARTTALSELSWRVKGWRDEHRPVWADALRVLSDHPRSVLLEELDMLARAGAPGVSAELTAKAFVNALHRVGEWWD